MTLTWQQDYSQFLTVPVVSTQYNKTGQDLNDHRPILYTFHQRKYFVFVWFCNL